MGHYYRVMEDIPDSLIYQPAFAVVESKDGTLYGDIWLVSRWGDKWVMMHPFEGGVVIVSSKAKEHVRITFIEDVLGD